MRRSSRPSSGSRRRAAAPASTFFEYNTLAALLLFAERRVELALLEVGLGGRLDATNLIDADASVVCSIGFDHRDWLGETLEEIGAEKAGIFRAGRDPRCSARRKCRRACTARSRDCGARPIVAERDFTWRVSFGRSQQPRWSYRGDRIEPRSTCRLRRWPARSSTATRRRRSPRSRRWPAMARTAARRRRSLQASMCADRGRALRRVRLAGRFQIVPGPVEWILDIAHNPPAAEVLAAAACGAALSGANARRRRHSR